jgi:hypothetical protein
MVYVRIKEKANSAMENRVVDVRKPSATAAKIPTTNAKAPDFK